MGGPLRTDDAPLACDALDVAPEPEVTEAGEEGVVEDGSRPPRELGVAVELVSSSSITP
jgi:hypothetical protein